MEATATLEIVGSYKGARKNEKPDTLKSKARRREVVAMGKRNLHYYLCPENPVRQ